MKMLSRNKLALNKGNGILETQPQVEINRHRKVYTWFITKEIYSNLSRKTSTNAKITEKTTFLSILSPESLPLPYKSNKCPLSNPSPS